MNNRRLIGSKDILPKHDDTAADAEEENVEACSDSGPEMDLKQRFAQSHTLRLFP
jgi:hypothetical protein